MTREESVKYLGVVMDYNRSVQMKYWRGRRFPIVSIATTDIRAGNLLIETFGGPLRKARGYYAFQRSHAKAIEIIQQIRPFMFLSVEVADEALQWKPIDRTEWMKERGRRSNGTFKATNKSRKVPCPSCGNPMMVYSKTCADCCKAKPKPTKVLIVPSLTQSDLTLSGKGKMVETPTGRIHRILG